MRVGGGRKDVKSIVAVPVNMILVLINKWSNIQVLHHSPNSRTSRYSVAGREKSALPTPVINFDLKMVERQSPIFSGFAEN